MVNTWCSLFLIYKKKFKTRSWFTESKNQFIFIQELLYVTHVKVLSRENKRNKKNKQIIISYKTFKKVSTSTVARWLKEIFKKAGIDEKVFSAHSYRSASTSAAFAGGVQLKDILETANWSKAKTFYTFYRRELSNNFSDTILSSSRCWLLHFLRKTVGCHRWITGTCISQISVFQTIYREQTYGQCVSEKLLILWTTVFWGMCKIIFFCIVC